MGKRIFGILIAVAGIVMILYSNYIFTQIGEGRGKIARAEKGMETGKSMFSLAPAEVRDSPYAKEVGGYATSSIQEKIDSGKATIEEYERIANGLKWGGWAAVIIGALLFLFSFTGGKKKQH